ncbi:lymphocyte antigen 96 [Chelydra serpentina]|uniref:Lymphocyte antigen 96 n=1 Tax=Chelydra serpentina TaxID=8475 RepID=A0A8T1RVB8_CHESE|nr:lymphocyte antigen 96 [Chelydra serpentina]
MLTLLHTVFFYLDSVDHIFFLSIVPCSFREGRWKVTLLGIPRSDLIFLEGSVNLWYDAVNVLPLKKVICHGFDDEYSFCGTLKGGKHKLGSSPFPNREQNPASYNPV